MLRKMRRHLSPGNYFAVLVVLFILLAGSAYGS
jgi:hypothetical protein